MTKEIKKNKYEIDMTNGPLLGKIISFSIPLILSSILQLLFNAADLIVVGQYCGPQSIAAVGSTGSLINLLLSLFIGLGVGVNVLSARFFAQKRYDDLSKTVHTSVLLAVIGGIATGVFGIVVAKPLLLLMGTPDDVIDLAVLYMRIYFVGLPAVVLYNFGSALLRGIGDTKRPLYFLTIAGVVNVGLNILFVRAFDMDVAGVALATTISQCISATLLLICIGRCDERYRLEIKKIRMDKAKAKAIISIGLPAGIQGIIFAVSAVIIQSAINSFGSMAVAGNSAASSLEGFVYMSMYSMYQSCITFTSQNYGAKKPKRINRVLWLCFTCTSVIGLVLGNLFYFFGRSLLSIYTTDPSAIEYGIERMAIICTTYFLAGIMDVVCASMRGMGYSTLPTIVSLIGACGFRIVWIYTVFARYHELNVLYWSYPISWVLTIAAHFVCYYIVTKKLFRTMRVSDKNI